MGRSSDGGHGGALSEHRSPHGAPRCDHARLSRDGRGDSRGGIGGYMPAPARADAQPQIPHPAEFELGGLREEHERLREEIVDLKITVDGLETERDFYFQKLRDIEILCQALEPNPDPNMTVAMFVEDVQRILYAKDDEE